MKKKLYHINSFNIPLENSFPYSFEGDCMFEFRLLNGDGEVLNGYQMYAFYIKIDESRVD